MRSTTRVPDRSRLPVPAALVLLALGTLLAPPGAGGQEEASGGREACASCHEEAEDRFRDRLLAHGDSSTCLTCHHIGFTNSPEEAAERRLEACASCHAELPPAHDPAMATVAMSDGALLGGEAPTCGDCHTLHRDPPVEAAGAALSARCVTCHEAPHPLHGGADAEEGPLCTDCHALHETGSAAGPVVVQATCVSCHEEVHPSHPVTGEDAVECTLCHSLAADAPVALSGATLTDACVSCHEEMPSAHEGHDAACADCHSFGSDPALEASAVEMSVRCGDCHEDAMEGFRAGGHSAGLETGSSAGRDQDLPTCLSCHVGHKEGAQDSTYVRLAATMRCVECHSDPLLAERHDLPASVGQSYLEDFHGATARFLWEHPSGEDQPSVMTCSDCHGAHRVEWSDEAVVAEVCARCHDGDGVKLAGAWLGHTPAGRDNQVIIWLLRLFYYVLIPFMLVGLILHIAIHFRDQKRRGARMATSEGVRRLWRRLRGEKVEEGRMVERFPLVDRVEHMGTMASFILLVVTGLPQTRPDLGAAQAVIGFFGGIVVTRWVHRIAGLFFVALLLAHVVRVVYRAVQRRRLPVMVPRIQDFHDTLASVKHYIWNTPKPKVGKFDFFQKFEYWGLFLGGLVMTSTGILLLFPDFFTTFLPGIVVAAGRVMHGLEATFATLVVVLWHAYGVILRPEIFPLDTSIFTGKVSVERLKHEHWREYERLFPEEAAAEEAQAREEGGDESGSDVTLQGPAELVGAGD